MTLSHIQEKLDQTLPGEKAHIRMAPYPKFIEGVDGIHAVPPIKSAVMILLVPYRDEWAIPFIKRGEAGKYHGGQMALPGGKSEREDINSRSTALRECQEEIGVPPEEVTIMGRLSDVYIPLSNFNITPFVGTTPKIPNFVLSKNEVEEVVLVPLSELFDDRNKTSLSFFRHDYEIVAPGYRVREHFIWGATAMMIAELDYLLKEDVKPFR